LLACGFGSGTLGCGGGAFGSGCAGCVGYGWRCGCLDLGWCRGRSLGLSLGFGFGEGCGRGEVMVDLLDACAEVGEGGEISQNFVPNRVVEDVGSEFMT
jgi:hypothetical protein